MKWILVAGLGSFIGGALRYAIGIYFRNNLLFGIPVSTMLVNIAGCFLIGIIFGLAEKETIGTSWTVFLIPGLLGGFTTFSTFSFETVDMIRSGMAGKAALYVALSVLTGLSATVAGLFIVKN